VLLLIPSDSPPWALASFASLSHPVALLRTAGKISPAFLLRFPFILDPAEITRPEKKDDLVLVSCDYSWINWAKGKGLRAIWLNPEGLPCPAVHPLHDLEIRDPAELQKPLNFSLPDLAETLEILRGHGVPENVIKHSAAVAGVAHFLAQRLRARGIEIDPLLVHRGGLLHDLDKVSSLNEDTEHGVKAAEILANLGYPELGKIAEAHVLKPGRLPRSWPEKLVFLADKLVEGGEVVGLSSRLSALRERYPQFREQIAASKPFVRSLQNQILLALGLSEEELLQELKSLDLELPAEFQENAA